MDTARVAVRLKPKSSPLDETVQSIAAPSKPAVLVRKSGSDTGVYQFCFHHVLSNASQGATYEACGEEILQAVLQGYNGTIMAYGQTGSGKTYTMMGTDTSHGLEPTSGLIPRCLHQLFAGLGGARLLHWRVRLSYLEIYNESFRDLLNPGTNGGDLGIFDSKGVICVRNLSCPECKTVQEAEEVIWKGLQNRQMAGHHLNSDSSRSHTVVSVWLDTVSQDGTSSSSKLNLVDLAGSERLAKTGVQGAMAREAVHINKSLTFLEQTVIALARKRQYVPFRSSKLTHFLKDSIGGNCKTLLIACAWSDAEHVSETLSTCRFAQRMMQVAENAQPNTGGLSSVHGNLFKLDPIMQQYLETMTAAAVAKEKAQLYAEFARHRPHQAVGLSDSQLKELEALRLRVKELEAREQSDCQVVKRDSASGMDGLRSRVQQLEQEIALEASRKSLWPAAQSELPPLAFPSAAERAAGDSLAKSTGIVHVPAAEDSEAGTDSGTDSETEQAQLGDSDVSHGQGALYSVDSRESAADAQVSISTELLAAKFVAGAYHKEEEVEEIGRLPSSDLRSSEDGLHGAVSGEFAGSSVVESLAVSVEAERGRGYRDFGREEEATNESPLSDSADTGHLLNPSRSVTTEEDVSGGSVPCTSGPGERYAGVGHDSRNHSDGYSDAAAEWRSPPSSEVDASVCASYADGWDPVVGGSFAVESVKAQARKKKGIFSRLFRKKGVEPSVQLEPFESLGEEPPAPNIVILNSLNHNQLLELLKARPIGLEAGQ